MNDRSSTTSDAFPRRPKLFSGPPRYVAGSPWGGISASLMTFLIVAGQAIGVVAASLVMSGRFMPEGLTSLASPGAIAIIVASQIASVVLVWLFANRDGRRREVLKLDAPSPGWGSLLAGGGLAITATGITELILYNALGTDIRSDTAWLADSFQSPAWMGTLLAAVVLAPLWEELTFRGFLLSALANTRLGFWGGALISNTAWTFLHGAYSVPGVASVFVAGLVLSWLLWRTGSIKAPLAAHAIANLVAVAFAILGPAAGS